MTSANLLVTIVNRQTINSRLFSEQEQYCYVRTDTIPPTTIVTVIVGTANWQMTVSGSYFSGMAIDGVVYPYLLDFQTASNQDFTDLETWLNGLNKGIFTVVKIGGHVTITLVCGDENGQQYDPQWVRVKSLVTVKGTCEVEKTVINCCNTCGVFYVFTADDIEYSICEDDATLGYDCIEETFDHARATRMLLDETTDYTGKVMRPNTCKIQEEANKVFM